MDFKVLLKMSEDWKKLDADSHDYMIYGEHRPLFEANVRTWEKHLNMSYFEYRRRLKNIMLGHWFHPWVENWEPYVGDKDVVLCPIDDDDIHHPDLFKHLREAFSDPEVKIVSWNTWVLELCKAHHVYEWPAHKFPWVHSNSYALRGDVLNGRKIHDHTKIIRSETRYLPLNLALRLEHPAGVWYLRHQEGVKYRLCTKWQEKLRLPPDLEWAAEVIEKATDLTKSLKWRDLSYL
jgi:hypothetical protein